MIRLLIKPKNVAKIKTLIRVGREKRLRCESPTPRHWMEALTASKDL